MRGITARRVGPVQVARDVKAGQAFEDYFLDGVAVARNPAGDPWIQGAAVFRKPPDYLEELRANCRLPAVRVRRATNLRDRLLAPVEMLLCEAVEPREKRIRWRGLSRTEPGDREQERGAPRHPNSPAAARQESGSCRDWPDKCAAWP